MVCRPLLPLFLAGLVAASPVAAAPAPTAFQADLLRLSEILGALTYLDGLCGSPEAGQWRGRMQGIIDGQKMTPDDRRLYVDVFNRGHRTFASVHRACTDQTRFVLERYLQEGAAIAERIGDLFGRGAGAPRLPRD